MKSNYSIFESFRSQLISEGYKSIIIINKYEGPEQCFLSKKNTLPDIVLKTNYLLVPLIDSYAVEIIKKHFDDKQCGLGQDFLVQVAPFGCSPGVVRSDLLEEQKTLLRKFIYSVEDASEFKFYINEEISRLAKSLESYKQDKDITQDSTMKIKYEKVFEILDSFKTDTVLTESRVSDLMKVQLLVSELQK
jgi:hypothetical protein